MFGWLIETAELARKHFKMGWSLVVGVSTLAFVLWDRRRSLDEINLKERAEVIAIGKGDEDSVTRAFRLFEKFEAQRAELFALRIDSFLPIELKHPVTVDFYFALPYWPLALVLLYGAYRLFYLLPFLVPGDDSKSRATEEKWLVIDFLVLTAVTAAAVACALLYRLPMAFSPRGWLLYAAIAYGVAVFVGQGLVEAYGKVEKRYADKWPAGLRLHRRVIQLLSRVGATLTPRPWWGHLGAIAILVSYFLPVIPFFQVALPIHRYVAFDKPSSWVLTFAYLGAVAILTLPLVKSPPARAWLRGAGWLLLAAGCGQIALGAINSGLLSAWWSTPMVPYKELVSIPAVSPSVLTIPRGLSERMHWILWSALAFLPAVICLVARLRRGVVWRSVAWVYGFFLSLVFFALFALSALSIGGLAWGTNLFLVGAAFAILGSRPRATATHFR